VYIRDADGAAGVNTSIQAIGEQLAITAGPSVISWPGVSPGAKKPNNERLPPY